MVPGETSPLLAKTKTEAKELLTRKKSEAKELLAHSLRSLDQHTSVVTFILLVVATVVNHWFSILVSIVSCAVCVKEGFTSYSIFDPLIFKSIFIVFGFLIGFRNVRANARRFDALASTQGMLTCVWDILVMIPDESRERVANQLLDCLRAIAAHVTLIAANRKTYLYAVAGLQCRDDAEGGESTRLGPAPLVGATMLAVEDEVDRLSKKEPDTQKYRRTFWFKRQSFDREFDLICNLAMPSVSDSYVMLINSCLLLFAAVLPWGLRCDDVVFTSPGLVYQHKVTIPAGFSLVCNTMVILFILFGLNTLASQNEDPFADSAQRIDIDGIVGVFAASVRDYDARRRVAAPGAVDHQSLHKSLAEGDAPLKPPT
jgi:predicted membrane chloride channel (bestrophin family)